MFLCQIRSKVEFPLELELPERMLSDDLIAKQLSGRSAEVLQLGTSNSSVQGSASSSSSSYSLIAVVLHHGEAAEGGHYTAYCIDDRQQVPTI